MSQVEGLSGATVSDVVNSITIDSKGLPIKSQLLFAICQLPEYQRLKSASIRANPR
jgi:hypothetical protein